MRSLTGYVFSVLLVLSLVAEPLRSQPLQEEPNQAPESEGAEPEESSDGDDRSSRDGIQPYDEVITDEAVSEHGVFVVHQIDEKVFYEIPTSELDKEYLLVTRISKSTLGQGFGGQKLGTRVVRWVRYGDRVFLRDVNHDVVADASLPIARAVDAANTESIIQAFDIAALGEGDAPVIDVTDLYAREVTELSARSRLRARGFDRDRSYFDRVMAFPTNIEVRAVHTYTRPPDNNAQQGGGGAGRGRGMAPGSATLEMAFSMVKLPKDPMMPRLFDERVGYFSLDLIDYGREEHRATERTYITRWRLEKQDPEAERSDPVKPIVYYIDPATPEKWIPWIKRGIEDWQPAFEAAGFTNAILARDAPSNEEDPNWSPEDARYSVIRWLPSETANASGPHVHDPRTGEILEADIQFHHNVQSLLRDWYFLQAAPLDPRAQTLPFPDDLMGRLLEYVVAHEVGHTLGFQHNMKASSTYDFEKVRDPEWLAEMSHTPTLMDYSRFNYVAQPEDNISPEHLIPIVGPYDKWATTWGYKPIPGASTPDEERPTLDQWALEQEDTPWYRFSTDGDRGSDPGDLTEAVGDANAIEATALGVRNLERVMDILLDATSERGRNWDELERLYGRILGQWVREMNHVGALVGGFESQQKHGGQEGVRFWPVSVTRQAEAVQFLNDNAFQTPAFMMRPEILRRIEPSGVLARVRSSQRSILNFLLNPARFTRMVEQEEIDPTAYGPNRFLRDLQAGIWRELGQDTVSTDAIRRNLQRLYLELFDERLNGGEPAPDDMRAFLRGHLKTLEGDVSAALTQADQTTRFHLEDVRDQIAQILDPKFARSGDAGNGGNTGDFDEPDPFDPYVVHGCWVDAIIEP